MIIIDGNGKEKEAKSVKKMIQQSPNAITDELVDEEFVEALIVGKNNNREWVEWYSLKDFQDKNPNIEV